MSVKCDIMKYVCKIIVLLLGPFLFNVDGFHKKEDGLIYILIWTRACFEPFNFVDMGQTAFMPCTYNNCFLTEKHDYFQNVQDFDVVMLNVIHLDRSMSLPPNRTSKQKYCMYGLDAAGYHAIPLEFNGYFNITFTYKLDSNVTIPYVVIKDENDEVIGPKLGLRFKKLEEMDATSDYVKSKLQNKSIAAAWIVSHCESPWRRIYAKKLQQELEKYGHVLDIYGKCGTKACPTGGYGTCGNSKCPRFERMDECLAIIESDYFFYLSFENSFGQDYVTEKLLHAVEHFTVPVVFGGADYSRFMPEGTYLNANDLQPDGMAAVMADIINDRQRYYDFFKWQNHYSYHFSGENRYSAELCRLCEFLNKSVNKTSTFHHIAEWWNQEQPPWPDEYFVEFEEQNAVEKMVAGFLDFLNPPTD